MVINSSLRIRKNERTKIQRGSVLSEQIQSAYPNHTIILILRQKHIPGLQENCPMLRRKSFIARKCVIFSRKENILASQKILQVHENDLSLFWTKMSQDQQKIVPYSKENVLGLQEQSVQIQNILVQGNNCSIFRIKKLLDSRKNCSMFKRKGL